MVFSLFFTDEINLNEINGYLEVIFYLNNILFFKFKNYECLLFIFHIPYSIPIRVGEAL